MLDAQIKKKYKVEHKNQLTITQIDKVFNYLDEEIKKNSEEVWEWWDNCSEVFEGSGYKCNQCEEELIEGAWDIKNGKPIAFRG